MNHDYLVDFNLIDLPVRHTDVLVVGGGIAGLTVAIIAAAKLDVCVVAKGSMRQTSTWHAQGGIAAPLAPDDSPDLHFQDTLAAGAGLCDPEAVKVLVEEAASAVSMLLDVGAGFDRQNGLLQLAREGGHTVSRIVHAGDATGSAIAASLNQTARNHQNISLAENVFVLDLLVDEGVCCGALVYEEDTGRFVVYLAQAVVLAAGGMGHLYSVTTNPPAATGDGLAMARRRGVSLAGLEFVQFHPTALYAQSDPRFLISEAVRGEGARLIDENGVRFMVGRHRLAELAPRDIVCRGIVDTMEASGRDHVFLDVRHLSAKQLIARFPAIYSRCLEAGYDPAREPVPVAPAAHYLIGGIRTDLFGRTNVSGLYASGEVASTGVHGANRLASNSLLEAMVFSRRIGSLLAKELMPGQVKAGVLKLKTPARKHGESLDKVRQELRRIMTEKVGVVRTGVDLADAADRLRGWRPLLGFQYENPRDWETINMITLADMIVARALERRRSVGVHLVAG